MRDFLAFTEAMNNIAPPIEPTQVLMGLLQNEGGRERDAAASERLGQDLASREVLARIAQQGGLDIARENRGSAKEVAQSQISANQALEATRLQNALEVEKAKADYQTMLEELRARLARDATQKIAPPTWADIPLLRGAGVDPEKLHKLYPVPPGFFLPKTK